MNVTFNLIIIEWFISVKVYNNKYAFEKDLFQTKHLKFNDEREKK